MCELVIRIYRDIPWHPDRGADDLYHLDPGMVTLGSQNIIVLE